MTPSFRSGPEPRVNPNSSPESRSRQNRERLFLRAFALSQWERVQGEGSKRQRDKERDYVVLARPSPNPHPAGEGFLLDYQPPLRYRHLKQMQLKTFSSSCWKRYVSVRKVFAHCSRLLRSAWSPLAARAAYLSSRRRPGDRGCGSFHRQRAVESAVAQVQSAPALQSAAQF